MSPNTPSPGQKPEKEKVARSGKSNHTAYQIQIRVTGERIVNLYERRNGNPVHPEFFDQYQNPIPLPYINKMVIQAKDGWVALFPTICGMGFIGDVTKNKTPADAHLRAKTEFEMTRYNILERLNGMGHNVTIRLMPFKAEDKPLIETSVDHNVPIHPNAKHQTPPPSV